MTRWILAAALLFSLDAQAFERLPAGAAWVCRNAGGSIVFAVNTDEVCKEKISTTHADFTVYRRRVLTDTDAERVDEIIEGIAAKQRNITISEFRDLLERRTR